MGSGGKRKKTVHVEDAEGERFFVMNHALLKGKAKRAFAHQPRKYASTVMVQPKKDWIPPAPGLI